jgi:hypothetical protein
LAFKKSSILHSEVFFISLIIQEFSLRLEFLGINMIEFLFWLLLLPVTIAVISFYFIFYQFTLESIRKLSIATVVVLLVSIALGFLYW